MSLYSPTVSILLHFSLRSNLTVGIMVFVFIFQNCYYLRMAGSIVVINSE
jgi:hypothetical protein